MTQKIQDFMNKGFKNLTVQERCDFKNEILSLPDVDATDVIYNLLDNDFKYMSDNDQENYEIEVFLSDEAFEKYYEIMNTNPDMVKFE